MKIKGGKRLKGMWRKNTPEKNKAKASKSQNICYIPSLSKKSIQTKVLHVIICIREVKSNNIIKNIVKMGKKLL